jgi:hypothetical protein
VEAAERRKDAQVARDYRVPLPLRLSDADIRAMSLEIAHFIATRLTTPVSIGVHRDSPVDAHGATKAAHQVGCHAHLYFPTRKILLDGAAAQEGKSGGSGMGEKHSFLTNAATSGFFLEDINRLWAEAANRYAKAAGLTADYDHRSYRRMGLKIKPQPRMGQAATAMERSGRPTKRGAHVLEVAAMSEVYRRVHAERIPRRSSASIHLAGATGAAGAGGVTGSSGANAGSSASMGASSKTSPTSPRTSSLTDRFLEVYAAGSEECMRPEQTLVFRFVRLIERAIYRLWRGCDQLADLRKETAQAQTASLDAKADLDEWKRHRRHAQPGEITNDSMWQRMIKGMGSWMDPSDPILVNRAQAASADAQTEAHLEVRVATAAAKVDDLKEQAIPLEREIAKHRRALRGGLRDLHQTHEEALPQLIAAAWIHEREWIERYMPELLGPVEEPDDDGGGQGQPQRAVLTPLRPGGRV